MSFESPDCLLADGRSARALSSKPDDLEECLLGPNEYEYPPASFSSPSHRWQPLASSDPDPSSLYSVSSDKYAEDLGMDPGSPYKTSDPFISSPPTLSLGVDGDHDGSRAPHSSRRKREALPIPFTTPFAVLLVTLMLVLAAGVEILHTLSDHFHGFTNPLIRDPNGWDKAHFLYTTIIVLISLPVSALWGWYTYWVKAVQPYLSLARGGETAEDTLLLDYTAENNFLILWPALRRGHHLTLLACLLSLLTLIVSPFASALFAVRAITVPSRNITTVGQTTVGVGPAMATLEPYVWASGFALAKSAYDLDWPPFIDQNGALARWNILPDWGTKGSVFADTVAVKMTTNCVNATSSAVLYGGNYTVTLSSSSCPSATFTHTILDTASPDMFIGALPQCAGNITDAEFLPAAFVAFVSGVPTAVICTPTMEVLNVHVGIDLALQGVLQSNSSGPVDAASNPLLKAPLNGQTPNGIALNSSAVVTPLLAERLSTTHVNLAAAIVDQVEATVDSATLLDAVETVYDCYLNVLASTAFFQPNITSGTGQLFSTQNRLIITATATHVLCAVFSILAVAGGFLMRAHALARRNSSFHMPEAPGLAGAVSVAGELTYLLGKEDRHDSDDLQQILKHHRYGLDREKRSIVVIEGGPDAENVRKRLSRSVPAGFGV